MTTQDYSGKYVRLYMGNGEYSKGKVKESRKMGDSWQFTFNGEDWHWADTRFVQEITKQPMGRRIVNFIIRALGYRMLNKVFRKMGL